MFKTLIVLILFSQHYLLMDPIGDAVNNGNWGKLEKITTNNLIVNMEEPLGLYGDYGNRRFIKRFGSIMKYFKVQSSEWVSKHIWEEYAVQSMNLIMLNRKSGNKDYYKFIFFLKRDRGEWKLYYLRGIKL